MSKLKPCPFCGEPPVRNDALGDYACYVHPYNGCFLECCVIPPEKFEKWNTRKSEPRKCCANCKHITEGGIYDDDNSYFCDLDPDGGQLCVLAWGEKDCEEWEGNE